MKNSKNQNRYRPENAKDIGYQDFLNSREARKALVDSLTLMDDVFFAAVMEDERVCTFVLREITEISTLKVKSCKVQYHISNLISHSVTLDVIAEDENGRIYNIEVQKSDKDHHPKRIRYYQANVDTAFLKKGVRYEQLPESWFIFISDFDPFNLGDNYYSIERRIEGRDDVISNGIHEIYLNTAVVNSRKITRLLQYFKNTDATSTEFGYLSDTVRFYKNDQKGDNIMCEKIQKLIDEANEEKDRLISEKDAEIMRLKKQIEEMNKNNNK